jgi:hypothetical protein
MRHPFSPRSMSQLTVLAMGLQLQLVGYIYITLLQHLNTGWWFYNVFYNNLEKYECQLGLLFQIYGKITFMFQTTSKLHYYNT